MLAADAAQAGWSSSGPISLPKTGSTPRTWKKSPLTRMPFALRTSPPVARLNRWSDQTAISANPSWRLRICSHMGKEGFAEIAVWSDQRRSEEHTSELQSQSNLVCRLLLEKKNE